MQTLPLGDLRPLRVFPSCVHISFWKEFCTYILLCSARNRTVPRSSVSRKTLRNENKPLSGHMPENCGQNSLKAGSKMFFCCFFLSFQAVTAPKDEKENHAPFKAAFKSLLWKEWAYLISLSPSHWYLNVILRCVCFFFPCIVDLFSKYNPHKGPTLCDSANNSKLNVQDRMRHAS